MVLGALAIRSDRNDPIDRQRLAGHAASVICRDPTELTQTARGHSVVYDGNYPAVK